MHLEQKCTYLFMYEDVLNLVTENLWQRPRSSNSMDFPMLFGIVQALHGALGGGDHNCIAYNADSIES